MAKDRRVSEAFSEVKHNPPQTVAKTRRKKGAKQARKQQIAIALSKARAKGARA